MVVRYVKNVFGCSSEDAKNTLEMVFSLLVQASEAAGSEKILHKHEKKDAYQIDASRYVIKNYKTSKFYQCSKCGRLTP